MPRFRFALPVLAFAASFFALHSAAQSVSPDSSVAPPAANRPGAHPDLPPFHGRSWKDYYDAVRAYARANAPDARAVIRRASAPPLALPDGGPLGNQTYTPYFSGADTTISFPSYNLWAGLQRQPNCSLSELLIGIQTTNFVSNYVVLQSIPNYEKYLHTISGFTTTPDKFPDGCVDPAAPAALGIVTYGGKVATGSSAGDIIGVGFPYSTTNTIHVPVLSSSERVSETFPVVGYNISGLFVADFNGDGNLDIAVVDSADTGGTQPQISILIANGDGTFKTPAQISVPGGVYGLVAGDFNGDKKVDLVATSSPSSGKYALLFLAGKGNGTFAPPVSTSTGSTEVLVTRPFQLTSSGNLDILGWSLSGTSSQLDLLENNGSAVFTSKLSSYTASAYSPIATGDLNGDGIPDLAIPSFDNNSVTVLEGASDGTFTAKNTYATVFAPDTAVITDIDGDGNNDLYVGTESDGYFGPVSAGGEVSYGEALLGHGDFTFSTPPALQPFTSGVSFNSNGLQTFAVADFNGDGNQDVAVASRNVTTGDAIISTFTGSSTGTFANGTAITFTGMDYEFTPVIVAAPLTTSAKSSLILNGTDTKTSSAALQTAVNNGSGSFTLGTILDVSAAVVSLAAADFNADSKTDIAFITDDNSSTSADALYVALGNGTGGFQSPTILDSSVNSGGLVYAVDVNNDGKPDIVVVAQNSSFTNTSVSVYLNKGSSFAAPVSFTTPDSADIYGLVIADLNGDKKIDIGVIGFNEATFANNFYLFTGNNSANFTYSSTTDLGENGGQTGVAVDVNQDGITDVVFDGFTPSVILGKGSGAFYPDQPFLVPENSYGVQALTLAGSKYPSLIFGGQGIVVPTVNHYAHAPSVAKAATTVTVTGGGTLSQGDYLELEVVVSQQNAAGQPSGTVTLSNGSTVLQSLSLGVGGAIYFSIDTSSLTPGSYNYTVNYLGDNFNLPSSATVSFKIIYATSLVFTVTPNPVPYGEKVTLKGVVTRNPGSGTPTGEVSFFDDGGNSLLASVKLVNGVASLTESTAGLPSGTYALVAAYYGDSDDGDSASPTINVVLVPKGLDGTTTSLALSPNPITYGQNAKLTATVKNATGTGTPTGSVDFSATLGGTKIDLGTFALNASGVASVSASTNGLYTDYPYNVTAVYKGSKTDYTSTSPTLSVLVRSQSVTTVTASPSTITPPGKVTLFATIYGAQYAPTGTVTFYADGVALGSAKLNSGASASFTASSAGINPGTYNITGVYSGDQYNGASTSAPIQVNVQ
jgi:hypothetical protein